MSSTTGRQPGTGGVAREGWAGRRSRHRAVLSVLAAAATAVAVAAGIGVAPAGAATEGEATFTGHGWGHGRGMGQYGALGYAVDHGWTHDRILAHFYGETVMGSVGAAEMTVELLAHTSKPLVVVGKDVRVNGQPMGAAVRLTVLGDGTVRAEKGTSCASTTWAAAGSFPANGTRVTSGVAGTALADLVRICEPTLERVYRGSLSVISHQGAQMVVNHLPTEDYLRGVVPREMPAGWASLGNGRGIEALKAQAVAARSYARSGRRATGALTCDTTACQVYGGAGVRRGTTFESLEDSRTDRAISETAGQVRMRSGTVMRTEFSSSTGGWTAGGAFPAVVDDGDRVAANPNHSWTTALPLSTVRKQLGVGVISSIRVTGRNGLGADGGRVMQVTVTSSTGTRTFTGAQMRSALGLKSDWFSVSTVSAAEAQAVVRALYQDILGRGPDPAGLDHWTSMVLRDGDARVVARGIVGSTERLHTFIRTEYRNALRRSPEPAGLAHWTSYLQGGTNVPELQVYIYASDEALLNLGRGDLGTWVDGVYRGILGRSASSEERAAWVSVAQRHDRPTVVRSIAMSDEAGLRRLDGYYATMLGRRPDPSGIATYLPLMRGNGDFLLPIEIGGSREYWLRSQTRF